MLHIRAVREFTAAQNAEVIGSANLRVEAVVISAQIESELTELPPDEAREFLSDLGVADSGVSQLIRAVYHLLGLRTYLTTGPKETTGVDNPRRRQGACGCRSDPQ